MAAMEARFRIEGVLRRYARGVDRADPAIVREAFHADARLNYGVIGDVGVDEFIEANIEDGWMDLERRLASSHFLSNTTVDLDDSGCLAWVETYFVSVSRRRIDDELVDWIFGGRYLDRFERRDDDWRIARRLVVEDWSRIERVTRTWGERSSGVRGRRGPEAHLDPVFSRL
jgi:hypothetical protein